MKLDISNEVQDALDEKLERAWAKGRTVKRVLLTKEERHELYSTGLVEKHTPGNLLRGWYRGVPIFAEEEQ